MILHVDFDAVYLVAPNAKSRIAGYYYLSNVLCSTHAPCPASKVHIVWNFMKHVVDSAVEAETAGLFYNDEEIALLRHILTALGHPQPPTQF